MGYSLSKKVRPFRSNTTLSQFKTTSDYLRESENFTQPNQGLADKLCMMGHLNDDSN